MAWFAVALLVTLRAADAQDVFIPARQLRGAANGSINAPVETEVMNMSMQRWHPKDPRLGSTFFGLKISAGHEQEVSIRVPTRWREEGCSRRTWDRLCIERTSRLMEDGSGPRGTQTLNFKGVREVVFTSHGVKSHTRNYVISTKSAGSFSVFSHWDGYSAPRGSGLRRNHHYKNTQYTFEAPAVFAAGNPGYVFYGSFEMQPGAKITLTMNDGGPFDLTSFDIDKLDISR